MISSKAIKESTLHSPLPLSLRLYVWPFAILYSLWIYLYLQREAMKLFEHEELYSLLLGLIALFNGLTYLSCFWSVTANAFISCKREKDPFTAKFIRIIPVQHRGSGQMAELVSEKITTNGDTETVLWFTFQKKKFIYNKDKKVFSKIDNSCSFTFGQLKKEQGMKDIGKVRETEQLFGLNKFDIPLPTFGELFKEHAVAPFFVFQLFCVGLWCLDEFWYYSVFTLFMLLIFESTVVQQRIRNLKEFRTMSIKPFDIYVNREGKWIKISSEFLLPGDLCSLCKIHSYVLAHRGEEVTVPCDIVIIDGSCVVNEAMLSGESTPLLKESIQHRRDEDVLDINGEHKIHLLFGGTKILQTSKSENSDAPENGAIGRVLRTGFRSQQGKLVRTMIFSTEMITANNLESLLFILFLLIFAIAAAVYVWIKGIEDETRNKYKLLLECVLIITAVVPPELPMELSLAVNTALIALSKFAIFCTEPFRIPFAGKIDICCFDKTGTLTDENLVVEVLSDSDPMAIKKDEIPQFASIVVASCHSLLKLSGGIVGDPMEHAAIDFVSWDIQKDDFLVSKKLKNASIRILKRFAFSSALKRMSVLSSLKIDGVEKMIVTVKGAPETLQSMIVRCPEWYEKVFQHFALKGSRIITLAYKELPKSLSSAQINDYPREETEKNLIFAGFLVFHCPMKAHSKNSIKMLQNSSHKTVMVTGDNHLTAIHVAKELNMIGNSLINISLDDDDGTLHLESFGDEQKSIRKVKIGESLNIDVKKYDLSLTGPAIDAFMTKYTQMAASVSVFARASPSQKELILTTLKECGYTTLMCGDGTNDVGALKQAHVGVALLDGKPEDLQKILNQARKEMIRKRNEEMKKTREEFAKRFGGRNIQLPEEPNVPSFLEDDGEVPMVRLGDASVAAPFTSKISTIDAVCNIIRQGRCTLVTTIQMYKILALNSLISAYSLSVLHLDGIRYGDFQVTITGMLLAGCFLFLSKSTPIKELSNKRPHPNIFNAYILLSVLLQFAVHVASLLYIVHHAKRLMFIRKLEDLKFEPSLLNSAIFLLSLSMQVSTFVVNYQGKPFRESLLENKPLRNSLAIVGSVAFICSLELFPEFNEWLELVIFPEFFKLQLFITMVLDFGLCWIIEIVCFYLFADSKSKIKTK